MATLREKLKSHKHFFRVNIMLQRVTLLRMNVISSAGVVEQKKMNGLSRELKSLCGFKGRLNIAVNFHC